MPPGLIAPNLTSRPQISFSAGWDTATSVAIKYCSPDAAVLLAPTISADRQCHTSKHRMYVAPPVTHRTVPTRNSRAIRIPISLARAATIAAAFHVGIL